MSNEDKPLIISGKKYKSRLFLGTGKYQNFEQTRQVIAKSAAEIVTVAIKRTNIGQDRGKPNLLDVLNPEIYTILPNTAGCFSAQDSIRVCLLARELLNGQSLVKLEVLGDRKNLFPNALETNKALQFLVKEGFQVMVYCTDDPIMARHFEDEGCVAVMPLAAPIGSGMGVRNRYNLETIVENASVPVVVDAGVGTASDAAVAMEVGCDAVLMNSAVAHADNPVLMARAMRHAVIAGRQAWCAGRMPKRRFARASSPKDSALT